MRSLNSIVGIYYIRGNELIFLQSFILESKPTKNRAPIKEDSVIKSKSPLTSQGLINANNHNNEYTNRNDILQ